MWDSQPERLLSEINDKLGKIEREINNNLGKIESDLGSSLSITSKLGDVEEKIDQIHYQLTPLGELYEISTAITVAAWFISLLLLAILALGIFALYHFW